MVFNTKYNIGDKVWTLNPKSAETVLRPIVGIRTQSVFESNKTIYCFVKDWCRNNKIITVDDCFWLSEDKVFLSKESLLANL